MGLGTNGRPVAVIAGCRTPFCKSGTEFNDVSAVDLARHAVVELLQRAELDGGSVDLVVMGQVVQSPLAPNLAREVSLLPQFPKQVPAYAVGEACASANQAITDAADQGTIVGRPVRDAVLRLVRGNKSRWGFKPVPRGRSGPDTNHFSFD